jgi:tetratricopeptide (TPR) repeat protein
MRRRVGRIAEGIDHARRAVAVALELEDLRRLSRGRDALGELYMAASDLDHASTVYTLMAEEALPYADLEPSDLVAARIGVGRVATLRGDWEAARASLEEAAALRAARGDAYLEGETLRNLAELRLAHGPAHFGDAADCAARAYQLHADHGRQYAAARARQTLALAMGSDEAAAARLGPP